MKNYIKMLLCQCIALSLLLTNISPALAEEMSVSPYMPMTTQVQLDGLEADIGILYQDGYYERVLKQGEILTLEMDAKNTGDKEKKIQFLLCMFDTEEKLISIASEEKNIEAGSVQQLSVSSMVPTEKMNKAVAYIWDTYNSSEPYIAFTMEMTEEDYFGDTFAGAAQINDTGKQIIGDINQRGDIDFIKFVAPSSGSYQLQCYEIFGNVTLSGALYNANQSSVTNNSGANGYTLTARLTAGQLYYLKTTSNGVGSYFITMQPSSEIQDFDIYEYDQEIYRYKERIKELCDEMFDLGSKELSQTIYNEFEMAYNKDLRLHETPFFLKNSQKSATTYDAQAKAYYATKKKEFDALKQEYLNILSKYDVNLSLSEDSPKEELPQNGFSMSRLSELPVTEEDEGEDAIEVSFQEFEESDIMLADYAPSLEVHSFGSESFQADIVFPVNQESSNQIMLWDFNRGNTVLKKPFPTGSRNGNYVIRNVRPGGIYVIAIIWVTDGKEDSMCQIVQMPYEKNNQEKLVTVAGNYVTATLEESDKAYTTERNFDNWLSNMDAVYQALQELTGYTPYGGRKIDLKSTRKDMNEESPVNKNYWEIITGQSGNPALLSRPFYASLMARLAVGDWGDLPIHELSHDFDRNDWEFDPEVLADLKLCYVLQSLSDSQIYRTDTMKYYKGTTINKFFEEDHMRGYNNTFKKGVYHNRGMTSVMLKIKDQAGWDAFRKTFRYFNHLSSDEYDYIYSNPVQSDQMGKFNLFLTKLRDYSGVNVMRAMSTNDRQVIEDQYGGTIEYYVAPPPVIGGGGGGGGAVNLPAGKDTVRRFIPQVSGAYNIFTSPYGGTGISNDTVIEVYSNDALTNRIAMNDDYGGTRFSKVTVNLSANQTYYIKLKAYNSSSEVHADLWVTKNIDPVDLSLDRPTDTQVSELEFSTFRFTASKSGQYIFTAGPYKGLAQPADREVIFEVYSDEALTERIAASQYEQGAFPQISVDLKTGTTYYLKFIGYLRKVAKARIMVTAPLDGFTGVTELQYNDGMPKLDYDKNTLTFKLNRTSGDTATYYIVPSFGWTENDLYDKIGVGKNETLQSDSHRITIPNIDLKGGNTNVLYTAIKVYDNDGPNKVLLWKSKAIPTEFENEKMPQTLEFIPRQDGGKYLYSNNRETVSKDDLADKNNPNGSQLLFRQTNLKTGTYTMMLTHRNTTQKLNGVVVGNSLDIKIDVQFYDPSQAHNSTLNITKYGTDLFGAGHPEKSWAGIEGYAGFFGGNIGRVRKQNPDMDDDPNNLIVKASDLSSKIKYPYHDFSDANIVWISQLYNGEYPAITEEEGIYTMMEFEVVSEAGITVSIAAYGAEVGLTGYIPTEDAPYKYDEALKGMTKFSPKTEASLNFTIDNNTRLDQPQWVTISNPFHPTGYAVDWWKTHMNPQFDEWNADRTLESDIIPLYYTDNEREWIFDTRRSSQGQNEILETPVLVGEDKRSSNHELAANLGNYGVCTTYNVSVTNQTGEDKIFCYNLMTVSNIFLAVRDDRGEYLKFDVDGTLVNAVCTGSAKTTGSLYPTGTNGDVRILVEPTHTDKDNVTELQVIVPANTTRNFDIDVVMATGEQGGLTTKILFRK